MTVIKCPVINKKGMHARAAAKIVALVCQFECQVTVTHHQKSAPGNSLIKLLTLNAPQGSELTIDANGKEAKRCLEELNQLFADGFGE